MHRLYCEVPRPMTLCSNLDNVVVGTGGLHSNQACPIMPDASTVAKRDVPSCRSFVIPSTVHFSLSTDKPWIS
jgi:hypothetical protein